MVACFFFGSAIGTEVSRRLYQPILDDYNQTIEACRKHIQSEQTPTIIIKNPHKKKWTWT